MPTVSDVLQTIETFAPSRWAFSFDKVGLQVGRMDSAVQRAVVALDWSDELFAFAKSLRATLIVCHHPLIWDPLTEVTESSRSSEMILRLAEDGIAMIACHTNWDAAPGGINDALAHHINLQDVVPFGSAAEVAMFKLATFVPAEAVDAVVDALSGVGAGQIGDYSRCAFKTQGEGTFLGSQETSPHVGKAGEIETVNEVRIEMQIRENAMPSAISALLLAHPYETPAYDIYPLAPLNEMAIGRIGTLENQMLFEEFVRKAEGDLATKCLAWGAPKKIISKVAVVGGAADSEWRYAFETGADVMLTGEVKQDRALDAVSSGICVVSAGHYATEQPGMAAFRTKIAHLTPEIEWTLFVPEPGFAGRPI